MNQTFTASLTQEDDWYVAQCLEVDVASQGRTKEEALMNPHEALELHVEPPVATIVPEVRTIETSERYPFIDILISRADALDLGGLVDINPLTNRPPWFPPKPSKPGLSKRWPTPMTANS